MKYILISLMLIGCSPSSKHKLAIQPKYKAGQKLRVIVPFYSECEVFEATDYQNVFGEYINYNGSVYCGDTWYRNVWFREDELVSK